MFLKLALHVIVLSTYRNIRPCMEAQHYKGFFNNIKCSIKQFIFTNNVINIFKVINTLTSDTVVQSRLK